jgi:hypothetical protein
MIYLTTFIITLFLTGTQIARALPQACGDLTPPESSTLDPYGDPQFSISVLLHATHDGTFDKPFSSMNDVSCSTGNNGLAAKFPKFINLPSFPNIGGAFDVWWNSPNCGGCWKITNLANNAEIYMIAIDSAGGGFNIAEGAYKKLNCGQLGQGASNYLEVVGEKVAPCFCGL